MFSDTVFDSFLENGFLLERECQITQNSFWICSSDTFSGRGYIILIGNNHNYNEIGYRIYFATMYDLRSYWD